MPKKSIPPVGGPKHAEKVLVVRRTDIFAGGVWHGIRKDNLKHYIHLISTKHQFLPRGKVEDDARWQQIIPYLIFEADGKFFLMQRRKSHTDKRLADKYSIGIGGHINEGDVREIKGNKGSMIIEWAKREFEEEIEYQGNYKAEFLGLINDDSNDVGLVHIGLVIKLMGDSNKISVRDEHKSGELVNVKALQKHTNHMETWSKIIYDYLMESKSQRVPTSSSKTQLGGASKGSSNNISGILPDWLIENYIDKSIIKISNLPSNWRKNIDQVSIDFHLGENIKLFRAGTYRFVDTRRGLPDNAMEEVNLRDGDPFILEPGAFAIASTKEILRLPADILGRLEGKSSLARLGILVHSTAARFDPGWNGAPVLELGNLGPKPAILYCGMPICAFTFEKLSSPVKMTYAGSRSDRYSGSKKAVASRIERHGKKR